MGQIYTGYNSHQDSGVRKPSVLSSPWQAVSLSPEGLWPSVHKEPSLDGICEKGAAHMSDYEILSLVISILVMLIMSSRRTK